MKSNPPATESVAEVSTTDSAGSNTVSARGIDTSMGASCNSACSPRISIQLDHALAAATIDVVDRRSEARQRHGRVLELVLGAIRLRAGADV